MRVIVVGAGIMGLASAWALARAGHEPVVYEQDSLPSPRASSVDRHRVIRYSYGTDHGYACMIGEAFRAWERLWADLGTRHYVETGHLTIAPPDDIWLTASRRSLDLLGVTYETLDGEAVAYRFPMYDPRRVPFALLTQSGGALFADRIVQGLIGLLRARGHALHAEARRREIDPARAAVRLEDGSMDSADALLVAAGAWTSRLVPAVAARAVPSRQVVIYMRPPAEQRAAWTRAPVLSDVSSPASSSIFYLIPPVGGTDLKFGDHRFTLGGDPDGDRAATGGRDPGGHAAGRAPPPRCRPLRAHRAAGLLLYLLAGRGVHRPRRGEGARPHRIFRPRLQVRGPDRRANGGAADRLPRARGLRALAGRQGGGLIDPSLGGPGSALPQLAEETQHEQPDRPAADEAQPQAPHCARSAGRDMAEHRSGQRQENRHQATNRGHAPERSSDLGPERASCHLWQGAGQLL